MDGRVTPTAVRFNFFGNIDESFGEFMQPAMVMWIATNEELRDDADCLAQAGAKKKTKRIPSIDLLRKSGESLLTAP